MEVNVTSSTEESPLDYQGVEILVTEHWDARCLNNGLFYVRASYRTLIFFNLFLRQIYVNPYTDNQNLFDAFLSHSTTDAAVPDARPVLRYALLDIDQQFGCAEGHANSAEGQGGLVTFHFWASDFRTREAAETEKGGSPPSGEATAAGPSGRIVARDGVERVEKIRAKKDELFEVFFSKAAQDRAHAGLGVFHVRLQSENCVGLAQYMSIYAILFGSGPAARTSMIEGSLAFQQQEPSSLHRQHG